MPTSSDARLPILFTMLAAATLSLAGCGAAEDDSTPSSTTNETEEASESPGFPDFFSTCTDATGDGSEGVDIAEASLHSDGSLVYAKTTFAEPLQPDDVRELGYLVSAFSEDGEIGYQFGTKFIDGNESANFVFDMG